jgi:hypothetical protein
MGDGIPFLTVLAHRVVEHLDVIEHILPGFLTCFVGPTPDAQILHQIGSLLADDHALRRLASLDEAEQLRTMLEGAIALGERLRQSADAQTAIQSLIARIKVQSDYLDLTIEPAALGLAGQPCWRWSIQLTARKPIREVKLRIDSNRADNTINADLLTLLIEEGTAFDRTLISACIRSASGRVAAGPISPGSCASPGSAPGSSKRSLMAPSPAS